MTPDNSVKLPRRGAKDILRATVLPSLWQRSSYVHTGEVRHALAKAGARIQPAAFNRYLHELMVQGAICSAGRGWYSSLATSFSLNCEPVQGIVAELEKQFPLLDFSCWSTGQVGSYGHNLLAKFVTFVYVERDAMTGVFEFLRDAGYDAHLNPRGAAARQFAIRKRTVVVRAKMITQPTDGHYTRIEGLLVDLFIESRDLRLMDDGDFFQLFMNLTRSARISMAQLVDYARRRKPATNDLLQSIKR